jgi:ZIP family zinc transporter
VSDALFVIGASAPLVLGALLGVVWRPPEPVLSGVLALATGALTAAVAFELFGPADRGGGTLRAALGFLTGALVFVVVDTLLDRYVEGRRTGFALLAAVTLDGVPENTALGVTLVGGGSLALLAAVFLSNLPESLAGTVTLREQGRSRAFAVGLWTAAAVLLAAAVLVGRLAFAGASPEALSLPLAFAGGAVLASLVDTLVPEAFARGGPWIALATAVGFVVAFLLSG